MKYGELIQFEPIESVIKLASADDRTEAQKLVQNYVISDGMAVSLREVVFRHLQFDRPDDNKGLLIVGNYGTGKSHLMAVVSALAERAELASSLGHPSLAASAQALAGRFQVVRTEIGAVQATLRDILCLALERGLRRLGVDYRFPPAEVVRENNKEDLARMMEAFHQRYPDQGLLLVVDELLDYLRGRKDFELVRDFGFLRELGEVCKDLRFRFMGGVQEALFDNPTFQFASETLLRVQARFGQVRIQREDVAFVVQERLLRKNPEQRGRIREHLQHFTHLYEAMNERLESYVALFPVHPAYLEVFERIYLAEKREVLKSLSDAIRRLLDQQVPEAEPGLLSYDSYWRELRENPSYRADTSFRTVLERSQTVENKVDQGFKGAALQRLKPMALRLLHALSVQRLAGNDIEAQVGVTVESLRDDLALTVPGMPVQKAEFLRTTVESALKEILRTVSGQYLTFNPENGQYFLDVKKDIDYQSIVEQRSESVSDSELDRYYFEVLLRVLEQPETGKRGDFFIWEHQVVWLERNVERLGYLFFGAPNERSTAQPPRDYYLYFLQPFAPPTFKDEKRPDEVFFRLAQRDAEFMTHLRLYAAARLVGHTAGGNRPQYEEKALVYLKRLVVWLRERMATAMEVTCQGVAHPLGEWLRGQRPPTAEIRDTVRTVASVALAGHLSELYPDYPRFRTLITEKNRVQSAQDALKHLAGVLESQHSRAVLDALELFQGAEIRPVDHRNPQGGSRYARHFWELLTSRPHGEVLNRAELFDRPFPGVEHDRRFRLEPEWVVVILASLVRGENITLALPGRNVDASSLKELTRLAMPELTQFKFVSRPRDFDSSALRELFRLVGLPDGLALDVEQGSDTAVQQLQNQVGLLADRLARARRTLAQNPTLWGTPLLADEDREARSRRLQELSQAVDGFQVLNSPARLKNLKLKASELAVLGEEVRALAQVEELQKLSDDLGPVAGYLAAGEGILGSDHPWQAEFHAFKSQLVADLRGGQGTKLASSMKAGLDRLRGSYAAAYREAHGRARLTSREDARKARLLKNPDLQRLRTLADIPHLPAGRLQDLENRLQRLRTCFSLEPSDLEVQPLCPHCSFRPSEEPDPAPAAARLENLEGEVAALLTEWTATLLAELEDPMTRGNLALLGPGPREAVEGFLAARSLPEKLQGSLLQGLTEAFSGLERVSLPLDSLRRALEEGGMPCTPEDLQQRFQQLLEAQVKGRERKRVRLVLE